MKKKMVSGRMAEWIKYEREFFTSIRIKSPLEQNAKRTTEKLKGAQKSMYTYIACVLLYVRQASDQKKNINNQKL